MTSFRTVYITLTLVIVLSLSESNAIPEKKDVIIPALFKTVEERKINVGHSLGDACSKNPCQNGGTCKLVGCEAVCECPAPFKGDTCEEDSCSKNPCQNGGTCQLVGTDAVCECPAPFKGDTCEEDACSKNPCQNEGTCKLVGIGAECECPAPFKGYFCEEDPCNPNPCKYNGTCDLVNGKAKCTCLQGIQGEFCDQACFHSSSIVLTPSGEKLMQDLTEGEEIASGFRPDGSFSYSPVIAFLHRDNNVESSFIILTTESSSTLLISNKHLIFRYTNQNNFEAIQAEKVQIGDRVYTKNVGEKGTVSIVTELKSTILKGVYAPLTLDGTIIVNNILASCYAETDSHTKSHVVFWPMRIHYYLRQFFENFDLLWNIPISMTSNKGLVLKENVNDLEANSVEKIFEPQGIHWYAQMLMWLNGSK